MRKRFIFLIFLLLYVNARRLRRVTRMDQDELDKAQRNKECCDKKMRCCVKVTPPPIEIRAVLARCPNLGVGDMRGPVSRTMNKPVMPSNELSIKSFQGFDEDEPLIQSRVTECRNKIIMTMKLHHKGAIVCKSQYIVVDHVYDPLTDKSVRLLNPYVIRLKQEPVSKSFHLKFVDYANSEAHEEVHNKQESNYTGCYTSKYRSTCGQVKFDGRIIPYSEGFCCSCDTKKNMQRQPESINDKMEEIISYSDPAYLLDRVGCPRTYFSDAGNDQLVHGKTVINITSSTTESILDAKNVVNSHEIYQNDNALQDPNKRSGTRSNSAPFKGRWKYTTYSKHKVIKEHTSTTYRPSYLKRQNPAERQPGDYLKKLSSQEKKSQRAYMEQVKRAHAAAPYLNPVEETREVFTQRLARKMRQTFPSGIQKRGGQNCADRYTPPGSDPEHYHESAHCLRFSDVWYGIYKLVEPNIEQFVNINIYERFESEDRIDKWRQITNGTIRMSSKMTHYEDEVPTISMTLTAKSLTDPEKYNNWNYKRILIPEGVRECDVNKYPEMRNGPDEYLVVGANRIAIEGDQCDHIGVGFEAFFKQPQRCGLPRGTCLHSQPKHLWRNDKSLEHKGKMGCFFLKYHANITKEPIYINETTGEKYLFVEYRGAHITIVDIEIKADMNAVIRDLANAAITEVYVDSTCGKYTILTIKVINTGLISTKFLVQLSDFPLELPEYFSKIRSKLVLIAPQTMHIFNLEIRSALPSDLMYCSVEVLNKKKELVALRRVRIQKFDRCICAWYCLCACVASVTGLKCNPMSLEHYHAAGFEGALPIVTYMVHFTLLDDLLSVAFYFTLFLLGILLVLGLFKAILGLCCGGIGVWGLSVVLDLPKPMTRYYERSLKKEPIMYDLDGWPIDPFTYQRARNISLATEFCSNVVFFFTYPLACTVIIFRRLCCPYYTKRRCPGSPENRQDKTASCSSCCKKKKKKSKKGAEHPCGDPKCNEDVCIRKNKFKRKKKSSGTDDSTKSRKKKGDASSKTSASSSKSSKSTKGKKGQKIVAAFALSQYRTPFQRAAEVKPSMALMDSGDSTIASRKDSFECKLEDFKHEEPELTTVSEASSFYAHIERNTTKQPVAKPRPETAARRTSTLVRSKKQPSTSSSESSHSQTALGQLRPNGKKQVKQDRSHSPPASSSSRNSDVSHDRDLSSIESHSRSSAPTSSIIESTSTEMPVTTEEVIVVIPRRDTVNSNLATASKGSIKSRPKSL